MAEIISINIKDQNLAGLENIEVEVWGTNRSDLSGPYQKIHSGTITTDSSGNATITTSVDLHPFDRLFDCKLSYQSELIKTISDLSLDEMISRGIYLRLYTISGVNAIVSGLVSQLTTRNPIEGVKVELWIENGNKLNSSDILTDTNGEFSYTILDPFFIEKYKSENVLIKLYYNDQLEHTETILGGTILEGKYKFELDVSLVDNRTISGQVNNVSGNRLNNIKIELFRRINTTDTLLGSMTTNNSGDYSISYEFDRTAPMGKTISVFIKATDAITDVELASSTPQPIPRENSTINISVDLGGTENRSINGYLSNVFNQDLVNYTVKAYAIIGGSETLLGNDASDTNGDYNIPYSFSYGSAATRYPKVFIKVFNTSTNQLLATSSQVTSTTNKIIDLQIEGIVYTESRIMSGQVSNTSGNRLNNIEIELFKRVNSTNSSLGTTTTNSSGHYSISYGLDYTTLLDKAQTVFIKATDTLSDEFINSTSPQSVSTQNYTVNISVDLGGTENRIINGNLSNVFNQGLINYTAKAYAIIGGTETLLGNDASDTNGDYNIPYSFTYNSASTRYPKVFIKVFNTSTNQLLATSSQVTSTTNKTIDLQVEGIVYTESRIMSGRVTNTSGNRRDNIEIELFKRENNIDISLGNYTTNHWGYYTIPYDLDYSTVLERTQTVFIKASDTLSNEFINSTSLQSVSTQNYDINISVDLGGTENRTISGNLSNVFGQDLVNHTVKAFAIINSTETLLATESSDAGGDYNITYSFSYDSAATRYPNIFIKVYNSSNQLLETSSQVTSAVNKTIDLLIEGIVYTETRSMSGQLTNTSGNRLKNVEIELFEKDNGADTLLGSTTTNGSGSYSINYDLNFTTVSEKTQNIFIKAINIDNDELLATSSQTPISEQNYTINISVDLGGTEEREVSGNIVDSNDTPCEGYRVNAFSHINTEKTLLGTSLINSIGDYQISYDFTYGSSIEKDLDLSIEVLDPDTGDLIEISQTFTTNTLHHIISLTLTKNIMSTTLRLRLWDGIKNEAVPNIGLQFCSTADDSPFHVDPIISDSEGMVTFISENSNFEPENPLLHIKFFDEDEFIYKHKHRVTSTLLLDHSLSVFYIDAIEITDEIKGKVIEKDTGLPLQNTKIELLYRDYTDGVTSYPLANTSEILTDSDGCFSYSVNDKYFLFKYPDFYINCYYDNEIMDTGGIYTASVLNSEFIIELSKVGDDVFLDKRHDQHRTVFGKIENEFNTSLSNFPVEAYQGTSDYTAPIGTCNTDEWGNYTISYIQSYVPTKHGGYTSYLSLRLLTPTGELFHTSPGFKATENQEYNLTLPNMQIDETRMIHGIITNQNGFAIDNQTVKAYSTTNGVETLLGTINTNSNGRYKIPYSFSYTPGETTTENLLIKLTNESEEIIATSKTYVYSDKFIEISLSYDEPILKYDRTVFGRITNENDLPLKNHKVIAYSKSNKVDKFLGSNYTDEDGNYEVPYSHPYISETSKESSVFIKVMDISGNSTLITSELHSSSIANLQIDLTAEGIIVIDSKLIFGKVSNEFNNPVENYTIKVFAKINGIEKEIGTNRSKTNGSYKVQYSTSHVPGYDKIAAITVKLFDDKNPQNEISSETIATSLDKKQLDFKLPHTLINEERLVIGTLTNDSERSMNACTIKAFRNINGIETLLGTDKVNVSGGYRIPFTFSYTPGESKVAILSVKLIDDTSGDTLAFSKSYLSSVTPQKIDLLFNETFEDQNRTIFGKISDEDEQGLNNYEVEAFRLNGKIEISLGTDITDTDGNYNVSFNTLKQLKNAAQVDVFIKLKDSTTHEVLQRSKTFKYSLVDQRIDLIKSAYKVEDRRVFGNIYSSDEFFDFTQYHVKAFRIEDGTEYYLGESSIGKSQGYNISYTHSYQTSEELSPDVFIKIIPDSSKASLQISDPCIQSSIEQRIDLTLAVLPGIKFNGKITNNNGGPINNLRADFVFNNNNKKTVDINSNGNYNLTYNPGEDFFVSVEIFDVVQGRVIKTSNQYDRGNVVDNVTGLPTLEIEEININSGTGSDDIITVTGKIVDEKNIALEGYTIFLYSKDNGKEIEKGSNETSTTGEYSITFDKIEDTYNLYIIVYTSLGKLYLMASPLYTKVTEDIVINLTVAEVCLDRPSFEKTSNSLTNSTLGELKKRVSKDDIILNAEQHKISTQEASIWVTARQLSEETNVDMQVYYAFLQENPYADLSTILLQKKSSITKTLTEAVEKNILDQDILENVEIHANNLVELAKEQILGNDQGQFNNIFNLSSLSVSEKEAFLDKYLLFEGKEEDFWTEASEVLNTKTEEVKHLLDLSKASLNNLSLIEQIQADGLVKSDIAAKDANYWELFIQDNSIAIPENIAGENEAEKLSIYAKYFKHSIELLYPTESLLRKIIADTEIDSSSIETYFASHPSLDLLEDTIEDSEELKTVQRLFAITPETDKFEAYKALHTNNIHSSLAATRKGKTYLKSLLKANIDENTIESIYSKAEALTFKSIMLFAHYTKDITNTPKSTTNASEQEDIFRDIFGSLDYSHTSHCQSVYGPASYLTDIMHFLENIVDDDKNDVLSSLLAKRPDLEYIDLNCDNTKTLIPFIDLINEILENAITQNTNYESIQTEDESEDVKCYPEHLNTDAYADDKLAEATYPWEAPFHLWNEEARVYLNHLDINRSDILKDIPTEKTINVVDKYFTNKTVAAEYLGINNLALITDSTSTGNTFDIDKVYGTGATTENLKVIEYLLKQSGLAYEVLTELIQSKYINPNQKTIEFNQEDPCALDLAVMPFERHEFLKLQKFWRLQQKLGWSISELDKTITARGNQIDEEFIIDCYFIEKIREQYDISVIEIISLWSNMDTSEYFENENSLYNKVYLSKALENSNESFTSATDIGTETNDKNARAHVLASLSISETDLDRITGNAASYNASLANLSKLYRVSKFCKTVGISIKDYTLLLELIDSDLKPLFPFTYPEETLGFINEIEKIKTSGWTIDDLYYLINGGGKSNSTLMINDEEISLFLEDIRSELKKIKDKYKITKTPFSQFIDDAISVENLDEATAMAISQLIQGNSTLSSLERTALISENNNAFSKLGLSESSFQDGKNSSDDNLYSAINNIIIDSENGDLDESEDHEEFNLFKENLRTLLALFIDDNDIIDEAMEIILDYSNTISNSVSSTALINEYFAPFTDTEQAINRLVTETGSNPLSLNAKLGRIIYVTNELIKTLMEDFLYQKFADAMGIDLSMMKTLFKEYFIEERILQSYSQFFRRDFFVSSTEDIERTNKFKLQFFYFEAIYKACLFIKHYKLSQIDIDTIHLDFANTSWLEFTSFPGQPVEFADDDFTANVSYDKWSKLEDAMQLNSTLFNEEVSIFEFMDKKLSNNELSLTDWIAELLNITAWDTTDSELEVLLVKCDLSEANNDFKDEKWLMAIYKVMKFATQLQISPTELVNLNIPKLEQKHSGSFRKLVKSTMDQSQWLSVAPKIRKPLREKQRDALSAYLLTNNPDGIELNDTADIYAHYLIDSEMSSCTMTSRIKQATLSVQLFIQRALMGLEDGVYIGDDEKEEWEWSKQYRLWEANRKIYVQPENYLEPDLRRDKSELFEEVEKLLKEDDITEEKVDHIYKTYLNGLSEIANLEVCDISANHTAFDYEDVNAETKHSRFKPGDGKSKATHVLARTKTSPHKYFYRKREDEIWTAWEHVDVEISGDQAVIVEFKKQVFVAWLEFTNTAIKKDSHDNNPEKASLEENYEIKLAWATRKNNKWSAKKLSKKSHNTNADWMQNNPHKVFHGAENLLDKSIYGIIPTTPWGESYIDFKIYMDAFYTYDQKGDDVLHNGSPCITNRIYPESNMYTSELCSFIFKNPYSDPKYTYRWHSNREKLHKDNLENGSYLHNNTSNVSKTTPITPIYLNINNNNNRSIPLFQYCCTKPSKLTYPSALCTEYMYRYHSGLSGHSAHDYKKAYYSQDPIIHEDENRSFFIMPEKGNSSGNNTTLKKMISSDLKESSPDNKTINLASVMEEKPRIIDQSVYFDKSKSTGIYNKQTNEFYWSNPHDDNQKDPDWIPEEVNYSNASAASSDMMYTFYRFHHPYANDFLEVVNDKGVPSLLSPKTTDKFFRQKSEPNKAVFVSPENFVSGINEQYIVSSHVKETYPKDEISFDTDDAYSVYNWEIFFHIPMLIADKLTKNKKFEEAQKWFHHIFDPSLINAPAEENKEVKKYWKIKPLIDIDKKFSASTYSIGKSYTADLETWRDDPFNPHAIAISRPIAYRKNVLMKYLDNIIDWADSLFAQDSMESINEATQLYIMTANLLGKKPVMTREHQPDAKNYTQLNTTNENNPNGLDDFSNAIIIVSDKIWESSKSANNNSSSTGQGTFALRPFDAYYFGFPNNDKLMSYWDTVADRLFKIRHCMNIKGIERQLALFQPPIDPALIAKALAGGLSLGEALNELNAPLSYYRFQAMYQKAMEITNDVKALGQSLLSALEKKDAESLSILRSGHELKLQSAIQQLKELSIEENEAQIKSLEFNIENINKRVDYYKTLVDKNLILKEQNHLDQIEKGNRAQIKAQQSTLLSQVYSKIPDFDFGSTGGLPFIHLGTKFGGTLLSTAQDFVTSLKNMESSEAQGKASKASIMAGHERRVQEWNFQMKTAEREAEQIQKQIIAAEIRKAMAERELENHEIQTQHSSEYFEFLKDKYTNEELYSWMSGQISDVYFHSYQMAVELAKKAERSYRFETNDDRSSFISYSNWDSRKKGLLAGEKLQSDLRRMDLAYMEKNKRQLELTKNVSLAMLNPDQLMNLRETGSCYIDIPEVLFDLDYPGQYMRRIKSVGITIPAVTGPHTNIACKLSLQSSRYRKNATLKGDKYAIENDSDDRFTFLAGGSESIATSTAQNDSGVFQLNFNDERYLPFEGAGAISMWNLELPNSIRQFDYDSISDVILHINYTALDDATLKGIAEEEMKNSLNLMLDELKQDKHGIYQAYSLKSNYSNELHTLLTNKSTELSVSPKELPYFIQDSLISDDSNDTIKVKKLDVIFNVNGELSGSIDILDKTNCPLAQGERGVYSTSIAIEAANEDEFTNPDNLLFELPENINIDISNVTGDEIEDVIIVLNYMIQ